MMIRKSEDSARRYRWIWLFIMVIVSGSSIPCFAQHSIKGRVLDENGEPLTYANVVLLSPADSTLQYYDVADSKGHYQIENIEPGDYLMQFSFVTKEAIYENVTIPSDAGEDFGEKVMKSSATMDEVVVAAEYIPIQIEQDTVAFNAKAFKTKTGAVAEDLLKKIPGIEVDKAGNVKALGEDVAKVLVDGKEFFDKDPKVATKNLPAKAIDKVQVYDKKSEEAEFMGIDDGVRERTLNLLLNEDNKKGYFGNAGAGGGTGNHYNTGGKIYRFSSQLQSALLGMYNNVNEFRFTGKDMEEFGRQVNGLNTAAAGGLNLSYSDTKFNRYFVSYLGSSTETDLKQTTSTENFLRDGSYHQTEDLDKKETNTPHRTHWGVRHKFNTRHNLIVDGDIDITSSDQVSHALRNTRRNGLLINDLENTSNNESDHVHVSVRGVDILKLNGNRTQVKTDISALYNENASEADWTNTTTVYDPDGVIADEQYQDSDTDRFRFSVSPTLVQRIKPLWYLNTNVSIGLNNESLDRKQGITRQDDTLIDSLSADFSTDESFVRPSLSLQRSTDKSQLSFTLGASWRQFDKMLKARSAGKSDYFHFLPGVSYHSSYRKGRYIRLGYSSSVNMPALHQLLPVTNTANRLSLTQGNVDLKPEYRHHISLMWSLFDHFSFTSLFARIGAGYTKDKISGSQTVNRDFTKMSTPVNVRYHYTAYSSVYFSTPVRALGIKANVMSSESWSRGISVINAEDNIQTVLSHTLDLNLENRRKEKWDIRVGGSVSLTDSRFSIAENNLFFNTKYYTDISFSPDEQWDFWTEANVVNYSSRSFDETVNIPLINASISYHLKGKKASISLRGTDLLDKDSGFRRISETNYLMQTESNTIGRFVMLGFIMRIGR